MNDTRDLERIRRQALALVNAARADVGAGEIEDFPQGARFALDERHPLVAALYPCGVRGLDHNALGTFLVCTDEDVAMQVGTIWGIPPQYTRPLTVYVDLEIFHEREPLRDFRQAFDHGRYPDLVAAVEEVA
ncbi:MAG: hypothetical protein AB7I38_18685 [Dehalococcoidia bacterium]